MKVWTDKSGKKLTASEFKQRFQEGLMKVTPLQMAKTTQKAYWIMLIGIVSGAIVSWVNHTWWLVIVLGAATISQFVTLLGNHQKIQTLKLYEIPKPLEVKQIEPQEKTYIN